MRDVIWTEKFRPKRVSMLVGNFKDKILEYLKNPKALPNFLLYSRTPGSGKTSTGMAIINELGCDYLLLNSSDDRNIETVREKIKDFAITKGSKPELKRCIMLDEADGLTRVAQDAMRNVMEVYSSNCFFILTCNNINRIIPPIQSRCQLIPFSHPDKSEIKTYLEYICQQENLEYNDEGLLFLIDTNYPNIRNCVISLQDLKVQNKAVFKENITPINEVYSIMWDKMKEKNWKDIKEVALKQQIDVRELNTYFWQRGLEESNLKLVQLCCRNEKDFAMGADELIVFVTSLVELCR